MTDQQSEALIRADELENIGADNQKHRPVMLHRAPFGSLERFIAVEIEHGAGNFQ